MLRVLAAFREAKLFVRHPEGRQGFSGHPIVPRSYLTWVNPDKLTAKIERHLTVVGKREILSKGVWDDSRFLCQRHGKRQESCQLLRTACACSVSATSSSFSSQR